MIHCNVLNCASPYVMVKIAYEKKARFSKIRSYEMLLSWDFDSKSKYSVKLSLNKNSTKGSMTGDRIQALCIT